MTMTPEMKDALVENLKLFNAKERDHLMRDAYLGIGSEASEVDYRETKRFLSAAFDEKLKEHIRAGDPRTSRQTNRSGNFSHFLKND